MSGLLSVLLTGSTGSNFPLSNSSNRTYSLRPDPKQSTLTTVHLPNASPNAYPIYSVTVNPDTKPNILFFHGSNDPRNVIGEGILHSSKAELSLHQRPFSMKKSSLSGTFSFEYPPTGTLKWKVDDLAGSPRELKDASGTKLAKIKSVGFAGYKGKELQILVPCDDAFAEMVVMSALAARSIAHEEIKLAGEIISAVVGA